MDYFCYLISNCSSKSVSSYVIIPMLEPYMEIKNDEEYILQDLAHHLNWLNGNFFKVLVIFIWQEFPTCKCDYDRQWSVES